ncbi:unnamed protein product, partial [marine sediment metagenome]
STSTWTTSANTCAVGNNQANNNTTGFTVLPAGLRFADGSFYGRAGNGDLWSASQYSATHAWDRDLLYGGATVTRYDDDKAVGFSVRCIRDF